VAETMNHRKTRTEIRKMLQVDATGPGLIASLEPFG